LFADPISLEVFMRRNAILYLLVFLAPTPWAAAQDKQQPKIDLGGSWTIMWVNDPANVNPLMLTQKGDKIEGTYINDKKEKCKVTGVIDREKGTVKFTIKGSEPNFEITCDGTLGDGKVIKGRYVAYGNANGDFSMSRMEKK
jgi:hypothetical protein